MVCIVLHLLLISVCRKFLYALLSRANLSFSRAFLFIFITFNQWFLLGLIQPWMCRLQILRMERTVLKKLEFKLGGPTPNLFCQYFAEQAEVNEKTVSLAMVCDCDYYFFRTRQHTAYSQGQSMVQVQHPATTTVIYTWNSPATHLYEIWLWL